MEYLFGAAVIAGLVGVPALVLWRVMRGRRELGTSPAERATFETLHTASLAGPPLRAGLTAEGAQKRLAAPARAARLPALAITDGERLLVYDGVGEHHAAQAFEHAAKATLEGRPHPGARPSSCELLECPVRHAVVVPLTTDDRVVGALAAYGAARLGRAGQGRRGGGRLGRLAAGAGRARPLPHAADGGRGAGAAGADLAALHLQLAHRDRLVRPHRPRAGPRAAAGVRRLHPLLLPPARRVHHAGRGAALDRAATSCSSGPASATGFR